MLVTRAKYRVRPFPAGIRRLGGLACLLFVLGSPQSAALEPEAAARIPHLNSRGEEAFTRYLVAGDHRAFAIAPGGGWGWHSGEPSRSAAEAEALRKCRTASRRNCVTYAVDDDVVFSQSAWSSLWGPYKSRVSASEASVGTGIGERFPNLAFRTRDGGQTSLSRFAGKVVVIHFWGSWCPTCCREVPDLQQLSAALKGNRDIVLVMLQVREPIQSTREWIDRMGLQVPLYDSGVSGEDDARLALAGGGSIEDREVAKLFPTTYVLDGNGVVVYSRLGAAQGWLEYLPFLRHVARHTAFDPGMEAPVESPLADGEEKSGEYLLDNS